MFEQINSSGIQQIAPLVGMQPMKGRSYGPCVVCGAETRGKADKRGPVGITPNGNGWNCFRCHNKGSLFDLICYRQTGATWQTLTEPERQSLKNYLQSHHLIHTKVNFMSVTTVNRMTGQEPPRVQPVSQNQSNSSNSIFAWHPKKPQQYIDCLWSEKGAAVRAYLQEERKLTEEAIRYSDLGCMIAGNNHWLVIPLKNTQGEIVNLRYRSIPPAKKTYRVCPGRPMPLYNAHSLTKDKSEFIVIVEGELDVIAMMSYGFYDNVISGTTGAASHWPDEWLDILEPYKGFYIWYDNDDAGRSGAAKIAEKLGKYRSLRVNYTTFNDIGEALENGVPVEEIEEALEHTERFIPTELRTVDHYGDMLEELINNPQTLCGNTTHSAKLDRCVGGIRDGELWVVTGDTGHGKTTWLTWLLLQQARAMVPVMVTSFEQRPIGTVQKLLRCELGGDFTKFSKGDREHALSCLGDLPIHILDHYGEINSDAVIETIRFSARRYGTKIVLVDHLGFLAASDGGAEERHVIESIVRKLATVAVQDNITIMLVAHPNNTSVYQQRRVKITDLKGASAIRQDAHVALVVERKKFDERVGFPVTAIHVDKVRSEFGNNGSSCNLAFDPLSCCYGDRWEDTPTGASGVKFKKGE